ncbi:MAG: 8-oxo-dGTP diphosphatase [Lachnospiraceae bacterium]|nr:8-oxo-dGTP diphosphatase [Lachnospiraceae bacterium]
MGKQAFTTLCYVEKDGKYLMLHRTKKEKDINKDKYIGIGGHIEHGETPNECIIREAREETGLRLINPRLRGLLTFVIDDMDEYTFLYTCTDFEGTLKECDEGDLEWIPKEKIKDLPLWEGDKIFFKMLEEKEDFFTLKLIYVNDKLVDYHFDKL